MMKKYKKTLIITSILILVPMLGFTGACLAGPVAWVMADIYLIPAFFHVYHLLQKRFEAQKDTGVFAEA